MFGWIAALRRALSGEDAPAPIVSEAQRVIEKERQLAEQVERADGLNACIVLYRRLVPGKHEQSLIAKIEKTARSFDDWHNIALSVGQKSALGELAQKRLKEIASNFEQFCRVAELEGLETAYRDMFIQKALSHAKTVAECVRLMNRLDHGSDAHKLVIVKIQSLATTADDWKELTDVLEETDPLRSVAFQKRVELSMTVDDLHDLFEDLPSNDPREQTVLNHLRSLNLPLSEWTAIREDDDKYDDFKEIAVEKEIELTTDPDELVDLLEAIADDFTDAAEKLKTKLTGMGFSIEKWRELAEGCTSQDSEIATLLWMEVVKLTATAAALIELHHDLENDGEEDQDDSVFEAIETKFIELATLSELRIVSKLSADDDFVSTVERAIQERAKAT